MSLMRSLAVYAWLPDSRPIVQIDEEIREELEFHLQMRTLDGIREGLTAEEARRKAEDRFGDQRRIHRDCRRILVGDRIMLQRFQALLTLLLLTAVVFLGVQFYLWQRDSNAAITAIYAASQPVVLQTSPATGATDVDPATTEIRAVFSKPMQDGNWSWCYSSEGGPETTGNPHYLPDGKTCVLPVKLKPETTYQIWLNSESFHNFRDCSGQPSVPYYLEFKTRK